MGDKCGRQGYTAQGNQSGRQVWKTSVGSLHLSPALVSHSGCLGPHEFTLVSHLSLTLVSHSGCLGPHEFTLVFHLSPTLVSHSGCLGPHEFTPVFHLSFTLVCHSGCLGPHEFTVYTCLPHSSPTLVFHTCLALWVPWAA